MVEICRGLHGQFDPEPALHAVHGIALRVEGLGLRFGVQGLGFSLPFPSADQRPDPPQQ